MLLNGVNILIFKNSDKYFLVSNKHDNNKLGILT